MRHFHDSDAIEAKVDAFVDDLVAELATAPATTPTPTFTPPQLTASATPTVIATPGAVNNRRCTGNMRTQCTTDADCSGVGGTCEYWLGGTLPFSSGGVSTCVIDQIAGAISGTYDVDAGGMAISLPVIQRVYTAPSLDHPCPQCVGDVTPNDGVMDGMCDAGQNVSQSCDVHGSSEYGATSLDCPPLLVGSLIATLAVDLSSTTGTDAMTLSTASPPCRAAGFNQPHCMGGANDGASCADDSECPGGVCSPPRCLCDSCNNPNAEGCATNADCPDPAGPIGPICGGRRCVNGSNSGAPCNATSECPGGSTCTVAGAATQPNQCDDAVCTPTGVNDGFCANGPFETYCSPRQTFRGCIVDQDCGAGDTCSLGRYRACFPTNGLLGDTVSAIGSADTPAGHEADPTLASLHCVAPTRSAAVNVSAGLSGAERVQMAWHLTDDGTGGTCPSTIGLFTAGENPGALDRGWTGLGHDSPFPTSIVLTTTVTGCAGSAPTCGVCTFTGPIPNGP